jgi:hypothetical protein
VLLTAFALAGCTHSESETENRSPPSGRSGEAVVESKATVDAVWLAGDRIYGLRGRRDPEKLAAPVSTALVGTLSPAAVADPSGARVLAYNSWRAKRPVIRLRELATGRESTLEDGTVSLAWRRDGALAYFKALQPDFGDARRYTGHVVVRRSRDATPISWTRKPGRYVVAAWARKRLLVYRMGKRWPDLLVLDGRGRVRVLTRAGALVAVSPDGRRAFVATYGSSPPRVRVMDLARGNAVANWAPRGRAIRWLGEAGSWSGENVAATASSGIAVFHVRSPRIDLEQVVSLPREAFSTGVLEPRLGPGERLVAWAELTSRPREPIPRAAVLECDRVKLRCEQAPPVSSALGPRLVYNPSRPESLR